MRRRGATGGTCIALGALLLGVALGGCVAPPANPPAQVRLEATSTRATWHFSSPTGLHTTPGDYSLWVDLSLSNIGEVSHELTPFAFEPVGIPYWYYSPPSATWSSISVAKGETATFAAGYPVEGLLTLTKVVFRIHDRLPVVNISLPAAAGPDPEVEMRNVALRWSTTGPNNQTAGAGERFLHLDGNMVNLWNQTFFAVGLDFRLVASDGSVLTPSWFVGDYDFAPGQTKHLTLVYMVPDGWTSARLDFSTRGPDYTEGPWANVLL